MGLFIGLWIIIGQLTVLHYLDKNENEYVEEINKGNLTTKRIIIGCILTVFLWPITIYNQEKRQK